MKQYMISVKHDYSDDSWVPSPEEMERLYASVAAFNEELAAAGVEVFATGLEPPSTATVVRTTDDGEVLTTDGPFIEAREHLGGFWIIKAPDLDVALDWAAKACRALGGGPVEVRPLQEEAED